MAHDVVPRPSFGRCDPDLLDIEAELDVRFDVGDVVECDARGIRIVARRDIGVHAPQPSPQTATAEAIGERTWSGQDRGDVQLVAVIGSRELEVIDTPCESPVVRDQLAVEQPEPGPHPATGAHAPAFVMIINGIVATAIATMMTR